MHKWKQAARDAGYDIWGMLIIAVAFLGIIASVWASR